MLSVFLLAADPGGACFLPKLAVGGLALPAAGDTAFGDDHRRAGFADAGVLSGGAYGDAVCDGVAVFTGGGSLGGCALAPRDVGSGCVDDGVLTSVSAVVVSVRRFSPWRW